MTKKILVVDDEKKIRNIVQAYLKKDNFIVKTAADGKKAIELLETFQPDLMVLDLMLPELSGEEICQHIRQSSKLPILMLTAKSREKDKINGLNYGADDYLVKPFSPRELVARVKAIIRRSDYQAEKSEVIIYNQGQIKIYPSSKIAELKGKNAELTNTEFNILYALIKNTGQVLSRDQLADKVMGLEFKGFDRTIDAHIKNIRKKLSLSRDDYIQTIYGAGYKFVGDQIE
jgi:DNA-binding response OmpR family regulator